MAYNFIDLFAGASGMSEGFIKAGFNPISHIEMDKDACDSIKTRAIYHYLIKEGKEKVYIDIFKTKYFKGRIMCTGAKRIIRFSFKYRNYR